MFLEHEVAASQIELILFDGVFHVQRTAVSALFTLFDVTELIMVLVAVATSRLSGQGPLQVCLCVLVLGALDLAFWSLGFGPFVKRLLGQRQALPVLQALKAHHIH